MEPDLMAELDAAEDVITGRVETVVTEWASRDLGGSAVFEMSHLGEEAARHVVEARNRNGVPCVLLRRTVTYGPWEEEPGA
jgi:hypothetical protein